MDLARIQERQQTGDEEDLEGAEKDRCRRVVEQEALRRGHVLRSQREHPSEDPLHHGGRLAGAFREKHVHPPDGRGAGEVRRTRFRGAERLESQSQELQGTRTQLGNGGRVQPHRKNAGNHQHLVRRRNEEGYVLLHELPAAAEGHRVDALLGQHRQGGQEHRHLLRSVGNGQNHPFDRPEARADRRRRARLGRRRCLQLRGRMLCQSHQPLERERARYLERDPPQRPAGERYGGQER